MGPATVTIDIVQVNNRLAEIQAKHKDKSADDLHAAQIEYITGLGFPPPSHFMVLAFGKAIADLKTQLEGELKNVGSGGTNHVLPASTPALATPSP